MSMRKLLFLLSILLQVAAVSAKVSHTYPVEIRSLAGWCGTLAYLTGVSHADGAQKRCGWGERGTLWRDGEFATRLHWGWRTFAAEINKKYAI